MAASYPIAVKSFTALNTGDAINDTDVEQAYDEITAMQQALLTDGLAHAVIPDATASDRDLGSTTKQWRDLELARNATIRGTTSLTKYEEAKTAPTISSNTLTLDLANGHHFAVALNANITTFTVSNVPAAGKAVVVTITFTADGTVRTITWPTGTVWPGGSGPTMTGTNNKRDIVSLYTWDGGTTWFGFVGGQNY